MEAVSSCSRSPSSAVAERLEERLERAAKDGNEEGAGGWLAMHCVAEAATYVEAVLDAKRLVVDPNAEIVSRHMEKLWSTMQKEAAEEVIAGGLRDGRCSSSRRRTFIGRC